MTVKEKLNWIDMNLKITYANTTLQMKNGVRHVGYIEYFDDSFELSQKNKIRFVRHQIDSIPLKKEIVETERANPKYSIILDVNEISTINGRTWDDLLKMNK